MRRGHSVSRDDDLAGFSPFFGLLMAIGLDLPLDRL